MLAHLESIAPKQNKSVSKSLLNSGSNLRSNETKPSRRAMGEVMSPRPRHVEEGTWGLKVKDELTLSLTEIQPLASMKTI